MYASSILQKVIMWGRELRGISKLCYGKVSYLVGNVKGEFSILERVFRGRVFLGELAVLLGELAELLGELAELLGELAEFLGELVELLGELGELLGELAELMGELVELLGELGELLGELEFVSLYHL